MFLSKCSQAFLLRSFVALAAMLAFLGALLAVEREDEITRTVARVKDSAVAITQHAPDEHVDVGAIIGAGCIIDEKYNYILTNQHVLSGQATVGVVLTDGTELVGYLVFEDAASDLAVVEVRRPGTHKLKEVRMASCSDLMLAERIMVFGSPKGKEHSVTFGRVGNLSRKLKFEGGKVIEDCVQTDAAINPGNSGGPAFNVNGEYVGTVNAHTRNSTGLGYFIKSDKVDNVLSEKLSVLEWEKLVHGIGTRVKVLKREGKDRQQLVVEKVTGPAADAGIKPNDVILKVKGLETRSKFDLERRLWDTGAGVPVNVTVLRDGKKVDLTLKLVKWTPPAELLKGIGSLGGPFAPFIMNLVPEKK